MKLKFNGGDKALLCDHCRTILATGARIPDEVLEETGEEKYYFCSASCAVKWHYELDKRIKVIIPENGIRPKPEEEINK